MDESTQKALEREFDEKSAQLRALMERLPEMQKATTQLNAALRARAVREKENAARQATAEMEIQLARCQQAHSDEKAAQAAGDEARLKRCQEIVAEAVKAHELAQRRTQDACRRYQETLKQQGFPDEAAYQRAFLTLPAQKKLEEKVGPYREEYAKLLARCEEIEKLLEG